MQGSPCERAFRLTNVRVLTCCITSRNTNFVRPQLWMTRNPQVFSFAFDRSCCRRLRCAKKIEKIVERNIPVREISNV